VKLVVEAEPSIKPEAIATFRDLLADSMSRYAADSKPVTLSVKLGRVVRVQGYGTGTAFDPAPATQHAVANTGRDPGQVAGGVPTVDDARGHNGIVGAATSLNLGSYTITDANGVVIESRPLQITPLMLPELFERGNYSPAADRSVLRAAADYLAGRVRRAGLSSARSSVSPVSVIVTTDQRGGERAAKQLRKAVEEEMNRIAKDAKPLTVTVAVTQPSRLHVSGFVMSPHVVSTNRAPVAFGRESLSVTGDAPLAPGANDGDVSLAPMTMGTFVLNGTYSITDEQGNVLDGGRVTYPTWQSQTPFEVYHSAAEDLAQRVKALSR
jgi:hypothetical protein